jgi:hypothetical protein
MANRNQNDSWERFEAWCADRGQVAEAPDWSTIVLLIRDHREHGIDGRELEEFVRAIGAALRDRSLEDPTGDERVVRELAGDAGGFLMPVTSDEALTELVEARARVSACSWPATTPPDVRARVASFYGGVAEMFERWVERQANKNTRRAIPTRRPRFRRVSEHPLARRRSRDSSCLRR